MHMYGMESAIAQLHSHQIWPFCDVIEEILSKICQSITMQKLVFIRCCRLCECMKTICMACCLRYESTTTGDVEFYTEATHLVSACKEGLFIEWAGNSSVLLYIQFFHLSQATFATFDHHYYFLE